MIRSKRRSKPSIFHPLDRKCRNYDKRGLLYMEFVKQYVCVACHADAWRFFLQTGDLFFLRADAGLSYSGYPTDFAHIGGKMSAKAPNFEGVPLCHKHHQGEGKDTKNCQERRKMRFFDDHNLDYPQIKAALHAAFDAMEVAA